MGNTKSKEIEITTKFYGENPTDDLTNLLVVNNYLNVISKN